MVNLREENFILFHSVGMPSEFPPNMTGLKAYFIVSCLFFSVGGRVFILYICSVMSFHDLYDVIPS